MSEVVLAYENAPSAPGANLAAMFFNTDGAFSFTDQSGLVHQVSTTFQAAPASGNATINATAGRVTANIGATTLVVTNNFVTENSVVISHAAANDVTGRINATVPTSGSFTIFMNAPTANMAVQFAVFNG